MGLPQRTDYTSKDKLRQRAVREVRAGHKPGSYEDHLLMVTFDRDFDKFAASTAFALRHRVTYRTDGGKFARGIVRASGQLEALHKNFIQSSVKTGDRVQFRAQIYRRAGSDPKARWEMSVQFQVAFNFGKDESEAVTSRDDMMADLERSFADQVLDYAREVLDNPTWHPPNGWGADRVKRMGDWITMARMMGYPNFLNLWVYDQYAVQFYLNSSDAARKRMTSQTAGKMPFDGWTGQTQWRVYPFKQMIEKCKKNKKDPDACRKQVGEVMRVVERDTLASINFMESVVNKGKAAADLDPFQGMSGRASDSAGPMASAFLVHVGALLADPRSLYSVYMRYSQWKPSWGTP